MPRDVASPAETREELVRELTLTQATTIVVGIVIGSGIFIGANRVAQGVGSVWALFAVWIGAGLLTLAGALTYAEFGALYPRSGGDFVFAKNGLGPFWGFFNGWLNFTINTPASVAALALAFAAQLDSLQGGTHRELLAPGFSLRFTAVAVIVLFTIINYLGVRQGGLAQEAVTFAKVLLILGLVAFGLFGSDSDPGHFAAAGSPATATLATAFVGAMWAYDGWTGLTRAAGEVKDPGRNVPRALATGILGVIAIYAIVTLAYLFVLGLDGMRGTGLPDQEARLLASRSADVLFGDNGQRIVGVIIMVSILGPINGLTLAGPRVYYAMARDRLFPAFLARVHPVRKVPHQSIFFQTGLAVVLTLFFTFEQLTAYVIFGSWAAYTVTGVALLRHRREHPGLERPYRVPYFPWTPRLFVLLSATFVLYLLVDSSRTPEGIVYLVGNLTMVALSYPAYRYFAARPARSAKHDL